MSTNFTLEDLQLKQVQFTSDCAVMQFVGIHDKNGYEVYEGDVVKIKNDSRTFYLRWFDDMRFAFADTRSDYEKTFYPTLDDAEGFPMDSEIEIIGNIYENPELLK